MSFLATLGFIGIAIPIVIVTLIVVGIYTIYKVKFRTEVAKTNEVILVTGRKLGTPETDKSVVLNEKGNHVKIVRGGIVVLKFLQKPERINLNSFQLNLSVTDIKVQNSDTIDAEATVQISIGDTHEHILAYSEQFSGKKDTQIREEVQAIITTHLRAVLTRLTVEEINSDRKTLNDSISEIAKSDLESLGFMVRSFGLGSVVDSVKEGGYLYNMERKRKAVMISEAEVIESENIKKTRVRKAQDEKEAKEVENAQAIEIANSNKERELRESEIKKEIDKTRAESETAYELEKASQNKQIELENNEVEKVRRVGAKQFAMIKAEEEKEVALKLAEQRVEEESKIQAQATYKAEAEAHIKRVNAESLAEVEITVAKAQAEKLKLEAEAQAEQVKAQGKAEAEKILDIGKAKAEAERLSAEAKLVAKDIILSEIALKQAPEMAMAIANALGSIDKVSIFSEGGNNGEGVTGGITNSLSSNVAKTYEMLKDVTGVDLSEVILNKSKENQVTINHETTALDSLKQDSDMVVASVKSTEVETVESATEEVEVVSEKETIEETSK